jgi:hypothetical protein
MDEESLRAKARSRPTAPYTRPASDSSGSTLTSRRGRRGARSQAAGGPPQMTEPMAVIAALITAHRLCADCVAKASMLPIADVRRLLGQLSLTLDLHVSTTARCMACDQVWLTYELSAPLRGSVPDVTDPHTILVVEDHEDAAPGGTLRTLGQKGVGLIRPRWAAL